MMKVSIQQEDITFINVYASSRGALRYATQILTDLKGEIESKTIITEDFNTLLTSMDRSSRKKIKKKTSNLNHTLDHMDLTYRTFHPKAPKCTFFSSAHETFSRIDHILGHKKSLNINSERLKSYQAYSLATIL